MIATTREGGRDFRDAGRKGVVCHGRVFRSETDGNLNFSGWYIDDVRMEK